MESALQTPTEEGVAMIAGSLQDSRKDISDSLWFRRIVDFVMKRHTPAFVPR